MNIIINIDDRIYYEAPFIEPITKKNKNKIKSLSGHVEEKSHFPDDHRNYGQYFGF